MPAAILENPVETPCNDSEESGHKRSLEVFNVSMTYVGNGPERTGQ